MSAIDVEKAHIFGLSLGAATGMWLAAKYPAKVKTLSLHSGWTKSDPFLKTVVESWRVAAKALGSVPEMVITTIFPWCLTPELYAARPDYIQALADFVRSRPGQLVGRRCRAISENGPQQGGERGRHHERGSRAVRAP